MCAFPGDMMYMQTHTHSLDVSSNVELTCSTDIKVTYSLCTHAFTALLSDHTQAYTQSQAQSKADSQAWKE